MKKHFYGNKSQAFSLVELSIVILVIGILIAAITKGSKLFSNVQLASARSITQGSIVNSTKGIIAWYETTLLESFKEDESSDGSKISSWNDTNPLSTLKINLEQTNESKKPTYVRYGLNNLPAIKLDGLTHLISEKFNIKNDQITVFIVAMRNQIVPETCIASFTKQNVTHDYNNNQSFLYYEGNNGQYVNTYRSGSRSIYSPHIGNNKSYVLSSIFDGKNNQIFINGDAAPQVASSGNFDIQRIALGGRWISSNIRSDEYIGLYGEMIIFDRALDSKRRRKIEEYLSKKWGIKLKN